VLDGLLMGSTRMRVPAGSVTHCEGEPDPHLELVVSGVVRVFVTAPDGRTMTVRYCRLGALIGVMSLFTAGFAMPATCGSPGTYSTLPRRGWGAEPVPGQRAGQELVARVSQQKLADAVGTVREVVVRNYIDRCRCMMAWLHRQPSM
jgi:hypothetical protein